MNTDHNPTGLAPRSPETRAFIAAQPAYDDALAKAEAAGAPPSTLNALFSTPPVWPGATLYPLTIGGRQLLEATGCAYLAGGPIRARDTGLVVLALTEPEWIGGHVVWQNDGTAVVNAKALAQRLAAIDIPGHAMKTIMDYFLRQLHILGGEEAREEEKSPLALTAAMGMAMTATTRPPAEVPAMPDGSACSTSESSDTGK